jgi:DNA-binding CsgD family transcriptional regulator
MPNPPANGSAANGSAPNAAAANPSWQNRRGAPARARWSPLLRGRQKECEALDTQLGAVREGRGGVLVLRGEAGIGKSALLDYVAERAAPCAVARAVGVQSEMELAYAGLHQLCAAMLDTVDGLEGAQHAALRVALGLREGTAPEPLAVAVAVLNLLSRVCEPTPLVCLVDDAQWLDRASARALAFAARRLAARRVLMIFAVREPAEVPELAGLPELRVDGLPDSDARLLLASGVPGRVDDQVRDRFVAETRGNPLALIELPRGLSPADLAGGFAIPVGALTGRLEQVFARRAESLPADSGDLLLLAAAEPLGDVALLWRAAELLGIGPGAAAPTEEAGLIEFGVRVRFRHPLVRSATYQAATPANRRRMHGALAEATDAGTDPDRRAWHRAQATAGLDEAVAAELERSAARAQRRGGAAAAAAFLQRAAELTPDPARRGERALAAVYAKIDAGAPDAASALLAMAQLCPLDAYHRAQARRLHAQLAFAPSRDSDALPLLLDAAAELVPFDTGPAREAVLDAFAAAVYAKRPGDDEQVRRVAVAALSVPPPSASAQAVDALIRGLAAVFTQGFTAAVPQLRAALQAVRNADDDQEVNRWLWLGCRIAFDLWDEQLSGELAERGLRLAREAGALSVLPIATSFRAGLHVHAGEFAAAATLMDESAAISEMTGTAPLVYTPPILAAYRGDAAVALALLDAADEHAVARGQGLASSMIGSARAVLFNGLARYDDALAVATIACADDGLGGLGLYGLGLIELIEAAVRAGKPELAGPALERLAERTRASSTDWALGTEARSRALLTDGPPAQALYEEAIERLSRGRVALHLARARLVYGEWLRREKRRAQAREQLRAAHEMFTAFGALAFAERARRELSATGETPRRRSADALTTLTPQEAQIARLVGQGLTNAEIGAQLFISPRTVEYHLRKVFGKLDISSRKQLRRSFTA